MYKEIVFLPKAMLIFMTMMVMLVVPAIAEEPASTDNCIGTESPGYWKNHPEAWNCNIIEIGGVTYDKDVAIAIMNMPVKGDKTYTMFPALVSAKLNVMVGNDCDCINDIIAAADCWMSENPPGSGVKGNSDEWKAGEDLYCMLDAYNNDE